MANQTATSEETSKPVHYEHSVHAPANQQWGAWVEGGSEEVVGRGPTKQAALTELIDQLTERMQVADPIALVDRVIDVMHKPPQTDVTKQLIADIRMEYEAGAQGYYLPRPTMKWLLDALDKQS